MHYLRYFIELYLEEHEIYIHPDTTGCIDFERANSTSRIKEAKYPGVDFDLGLRFHSNVNLLQRGKAEFRVMHTLLTRLSKLKTKGKLILFKYSARY